MKTPLRSPERFDRFAAMSDVPMMVLGILWIPVLEIPFFTQLPSTTNRVFLLLDTIVWTIFALEYVVKLFLAPSRSDFIRHHVLDLIVIALPLLRPLRGLQVLRLLNVARAGAVSWKVLGRLREVFDKKHYSVLLALAASAVVMSAVAEYA